MKEETMHKTGALHLRLMDDEDQYINMLNILSDYWEDNEHYTTDVLNALEDGLENYNRYLRLDNELSPRFIKIEKRVTDPCPSVNANDTEGAYHVLFHFDDDKEQKVHFDRRQDKLLYVLILLSSLKNGFTAECLRKPQKSDYTDRDGNFDQEAYTTADVRYASAMAAVTKLMKAVYPADNINDHVIREMDPSVSFTDIVQKMKSTVTKVLNKHGRKYERRWFMPYTFNVGKKRIYHMYMEPTRIILPDELKPVVDALPLADDYVDMSSYESDEMSKEHYEYLLKGVLADDVECINLLAQAYNDGIGRMADPMKAFSLWKKSAEMGNAEGLYYMGVFYGTGDIVSQDYSKSTQFFQRAADQGHADALFQLGIYKMHGFGCKIDWNEALTYLKAAAGKGSADAANEVGYIYDRGEHGVKKDDMEAFRWFLKAAEMGHTEAILYVIRAYHDGLVEDDGHKALQYWIEKGIELEIPRFWLQMGLFMYQDEEYELAFDFFTKANEAGLSSANRVLAEMLLKGKGVARDAEKAFRYIYDGALDGDETCIKWVKESKTDYWDDLRDELDNIVDMRTLLLSLVEAFDPDANQEYFLRLVDSYRECFGDDYQKEINRQLSIHRPSTDGGGHHERRITVSRTSSGKARYKISITLANGQERYVKLNPNSLVLLLLAIICSYKSGYNTVMTLDRTCRAVMVDLVRAVLGDMSDEQAISYVEKYMASPKCGTDSYKLYSKSAKEAIESAVGESDEHNCYLFGNNETVSRRPLRTMNLDVHFIDLPEELMQLATRMPDGRRMLYSLEDESVISE